MNTKQMLLLCLSWHCENVNTKQLFVRMLFIFLSTPLDHTIHIFFVELVIKYLTRPIPDVLTHNQFQLFLAQIHVSTVSYKSLYCNIFVCRIQCVCYFCYVQRYDLHSLLKLFCCPCLFSTSSDFFIEFK